jgi:hypothetical protein
VTLVPSLILKALLSFVCAKASRKFKFSLSNNLKVKLFHYFLPPRSVLISLDRSVLIQNPKSKVKIAVCSNMMSSALDHPNGKVIQNFERVDIMAFDGTKKLNKYV